jgi:hypothetical protein
MNSISKKIWLLLLLPAVLILNACDKTSTKVIPDLSNPIIKMTIPAKNGQANSKNPIAIIGTATDNKLATLDVTVYNVTDTVVIYKNSSAISGDGITINKTYLKYYDKIKSCLLEVIVKDASGNKAVDSTRFTVLN